MDGILSKIDVFDILAKKEKKWKNAVHKKIHDLFY